MPGQEVPTCGSPHKFPHCCSFGATWTSDHTAYIEQQPPAARMGQVSSTYPAPPSTWWLPLQTLLINPVFNDGTWGSKHMAHIISLLGIPGLRAPNIRQCQGKVPADLVWWEGPGADSVELHHLRVWVDLLENLCTHCWEKQLLLPWILEGYQESLELACRIKQVSVMTWSQCLHAVHYRDTFPFCPVKKAQHRTAHGGNENGVCVCVLCVVCTQFILPVFLPEGDAYRVYVPCLKCLGPF